MAKSCIAFLLLLFAQIVIAEDEMSETGDISSIFLNTKPAAYYPSPSSSAFSRRGVKNNRPSPTSPILRLTGAGNKISGFNNKDSKIKTPTTPAPPPTSTSTPYHTSLSASSFLSSSTSSNPTIVGHIKMNIDSASIKKWPPKWWGCNIDQQATPQPTTTTMITIAGEDSSSAEELFISSQIENLVLKAHIVIRAELFAATATNYPPPAMSSDGEETAIESAEPIWTRAEFKVLEIFRFSDLRGKGKPFLDGYGTPNSRIAVSFRASPALVASGMTSENNDCFTSMLTPTTPAVSPIRQSNMLRKRNIKIGLTYLLFIAITNGTTSQLAGVGASTSVPLTANKEDLSSMAAIDLATPTPPSSSLPMSQQLHYSLMAPPLVFHKRFRHSIYNVLCTDCTSAPSIKQLTIKFNATQGILSAYCSSPAHPIPTFTWTLDGVELQENNSGDTASGATLIVDRIRSTRKNSKIEISGIGQGRTHRLTCSAQNHFGHVTISQPFILQGNKMSMLLLSDEHNAALNLTGSNIIYDSVDFYSTTPAPPLLCLSNLGRQILDWALMNPWISVFIGLACITVLLAIALLILKCALRARFNSASRAGNNKCHQNHQHHHNNRHHERSPSFNGGTIVIDSSCNGDDCVTTSAGSGGRHYLTAESKVPLLGKSANRNNKRNNQHHNHLAVMVTGNELPPNDATTSESRHGVSPGSGASIGDGSSSGGEHNGKIGVLAASSNSTTSSSAGAVGSGNSSANGSFARVQNQPHSTFRALQQQQPKPTGPPTAPRPTSAAMTQSWHESGLIDYSHPPEVPPQTYLYSMPQSHQATLLIRQPMPPPEPESDVVVKLLPALSAASSLAEFLGHENEHIEVVPEANEDDLGMSDDDRSSGNKMIDEGPVMSIDSDNEDMVQMRRRGFELEPEVDNIVIVNNHPGIKPAPVVGLTLTELLNDQKNNFIMSSNQNTAIFRPLQTTSKDQ